ncbi:MAG TPA: DUF3634 family protein [Pirellulales bacterium]|nr:DUF3634 family protein [Pirellulales bacterium]
MKLAILGFFAWVVWKVIQPRCLFTVRIVGGEPTVSTGAVTPAFLGHVRELCREYSFDRGSIRGVVRGPRISLAFSQEIPTEARQALRNWWAISGWLAVPRRCK